MSKTTRERKAPGSGPVVELPPAANATSLFLHEILRPREKLGSNHRDLRRYADKERIKDYETRDD
jgi:hypothetical protein